MRLLIVSAILLVGTPVASIKAAEPAPSVVGVDMFGVDAMWAGTRHEVGEKKGKGRTKPMSLHIEARSGDHFTGHVDFGGTAAGNLQVAVEGTVPDKDGAFIYFSTSEERGAFSARFEGPLRGDVLSLKFSGTTLKGQHIEGTAELKPGKRKQAS